MAAYDDWSEYYDLLQRGLPGDVEFYVGQAIRAGGETLEVGCGTGRIAIPMAMSGVNVTGLDDSRSMLDRCRATKRAAGSIPGRLKLVKADMKSFDLGCEFDFIAMPYRTFMHLLDPFEQRQCLETIWRHLKPGGLFIFNTWAARPSAIAPFLGPHCGAMRLVSREEERDGERGLLHYCASTYDEWTQLLREDHVIQELDAKGRIVKTTTLPMVRAWATPRELELLVALCGFEVEAAFGDFDCGPFTRSSTEIIWVLRRPH